MSKREELRKRRQAQARQRQLMLVGLVTLAAVAVAGYFIYQNYQKQVYDSKPIGAFVTPEPAAFPQADGKALGPAEAKVTVVEYADFQCPFCGRFATTIEPQIIEQYVATGQVRFEYHHFIVVDGNVGGAESRRAAEASECANAQGLFWDYQLMVYTNQQGEGRGAFADRRLKAFAEATGLDTAEFNACFDSGRFAGAGRAHGPQARSIGLTSTPSILVNGRLVPNPDFASIAAAIEVELKQ